MRLVELVDADEGRAKVLARSCWSLVEALTLFLVFPPLLSDAGGEIATLVAGVSRMLSSREAESTDGGESDEAVETESFVLTAGMATSIMKDDVLVERRVGWGVGPEVDAAVVSSFSGA